MGWLSLLCAVLARLCVFVSISMYVVCVCVCVRVPAVSFVAVLLMGQVGAPGALVLLTLSNGVYSFQSGPCNVTVPSTAVVCTAPAGVGMRHAVTLTVDGVASAPFANRTISYAAPAVASLTLQPANADGSVNTTGGVTVTIAGSNFGPAGLSPPSLGTVTYTSVDLAVAGGIEVGGGLLL